MDYALFASALFHLGLAAAAWRLANVLAGRVENHEVRIVVLETKEA